MLLHAQSQQAVSPLTLPAPHHVHRHNEHRPLPTQALLNQTDHGLRKNWTREGFQGGKPHHTQDMYVLGKSKRGTNVFRNCWGGLQARGTADPEAAERKKGHFSIGGKAC